MNRLARSFVISILTDDATPNYGATVSGYGRKIPTRYRIVLKRGGIRRVYMMQYGNSGTPYVIVGGQELTVEHLFP